MDVKQKSNESKKKDLRTSSKSKTEGIELISERYAHYDMYVRHPYFVPGAKNVYHIRKSLAEYLKEQLLFAPGVYFQRVYMFAKKRGGDQQTTEEPIDKEREDKVSEEESEYNALSSDSEIFSDFEEEELEYIQERFVKRLSKTRIKKPDKTNKENGYIEAKLLELMNEMDKTNITTNKISGRFISLGDDYAVFIFESSEDVIGNFLYNMHKISNHIWSECRIFLLEDHICQTFYDDFTTVEYPAINTQQKLLPTLTEDRDFMARQHFDLKNRLNKVCEILSPKISSNIQPDPVADISEMSEGSHKELSSIDYMKMYLPEVQRIELILKCEKFYHSFKQFIRIYGIIPHQKDEDAFSWPLPTDYTPSGIFRRNEFDVNLTFEDYLQEDTTVEQRGSSESQTSNY